MKRSKPHNTTSPKPGPEEHLPTGGFWNWVSSGPSEQENLLTRKNKELTDRNDTLRDLTRQQMKMISQQESEIMSLNRQLKRLSNGQQELEDQVLIAQAAMSKRTARSRTGLAEEERTIKGNFINLQNEVKKWGKTWGNAPFSIINSLSGEDEEKFLKQLGMVVALEDGQIPDTLKSEDMSIKSSILCVSAMLGRQICVEVMEDPFRALRACLISDTASSRVISKNYGTLQDIYDKLSYRKRHTPKILLVFLTIVSRRSQSTNLEK
jgi:hypothetical protein